MRKVRLLTLVLPATIRHGNGLHAGELRQPTKDDDCDNVFNADAGVDTEYFSVPGYEGQAAFCRTFHRHFGMSPTRYRRDTPGKESNLQYPLRVGMEMEQEAVCRCSGRPGSANGFRRHDATSADIMANPVILAQEVI